MTAEDTGVYRTAAGGKTWQQATASDITLGFDANDEPSEIPAQWKAGKSIQMLEASRHDG